MIVENRQFDAFAITFSFLGAATVTVVLRIVSRLKLGHFHWGMFSPLT